MTNIADKFGKSSVDTDYAIATTVKTTRASGTLVLECFDLSKFAVNTPVFFITYKKTTNPVTGDVTVTNQVSWKALVNAGANTLTNLTLAPGYTDLGNDTGDFVECIPTSFWENSLVDGLLTSLNPDGTLKVVTQNPGWTLLTGSPMPTVTALGNRSYSMVFSGVDLTPTISNGMRLRTTRTVAAPTQSTLLGGTKYWVKTSPNKMTFTNNFVIDVSVKLTSYADGGIISRYNGTSGWELITLSTGQVVLRGFNASSSNLKGVQSYQSLPLNKWVRITAQLDMATGTVTPTTNYIMFDGIDISASIVQSGTNPTALIQAGNLEIGSRNGGTLPLQGEVAQAAIFNAKVTQATMLTYMSQGYSGTETSIASAYSFNGVATDLNTTTPNDLTAMNSAGYAADSPFGTQASGLISSTLDYGIVQSCTFSTNTTIVVQVPEGCTIPTSGGVSAVSYSSVKAPYGFPTDENRNTLIVFANSRYDRGSTGNIVAYMNHKLSLPLGKWSVSMKVPSWTVRSSAGAIRTGVDLNRTQAIVYGYSPLYTEVNASNVSELYGAHILSSVPIETTSTTPTDYYLNMNNGIGFTMTDFAVLADFWCMYITAKNAYL